MLPMSSHEDEGNSDEELPCVTLSQSAGSKSELEMPPASEIASLRAREDAAERALQDLQDSCKDPLLVSLSRSASQGSSGEEGEAALSAAVSALQVTEPPGDRSTRDYLQLLTAMRDNFSEHSAFLNEYIRVLTEKPEKVDTVTEHILRGISSSLVSGQAPSDPGVCLWLLCVALRGPRGLRARRALHALLDGEGQRVHALATAVSAAMEDAEQLLAAYDAVRSGLRRGADRLAAALLAQATARLLPRQDASAASPPSPLSPASVALVTSSWRRLPARAQLTLLRVAGRALAAADTGDMRDTGDMQDTGDTRDMKDTGDTGDTGDKDLKNTREKDMGDSESMDTGESKDMETQDTKPTDGSADNKATGDTKSSETIGDTTMTTSIEDTRAAEREGGAALLAALSQPLPRASAFHIDRQQVLTNISKLQLLFRSRFMSETEDSALVEEFFNCSQNSVDSLDTPLKLDTPIKEETPIKKFTPMKLEMKVKIPMSLVAPMKLDNPLKTPLQMDTQLTETLVKIETPIQINTPIKIETPLTRGQMDRSKEPIGTPVKGGRIATQLKIDGFFKQLTPVKVEKVDEERSPDRKRIRREREHRYERRYPQKSGKR